jgi:hypothetical protein
MATENPAWPMCLGRPYKTKLGQLINRHDLLWLWLDNMRLWFDYMADIATEDQGAYGPGGQDGSDRWES